MRAALQRNLIIMAVRDLVSKKVRLVLNLLGIVIGVSALLFLLSLTEGMRKTILKELVGSIPITEMTATRAEKDVPTGKGGGWLLDKMVGTKGAEGLVLRQPLREDLTDETITEIEQIPGVRRVYGVKTLKRVPTSVEGWLFGIDDMHFLSEAVVYGYPKALLEGDVDDLSDFYFRPGSALDAFPVPLKLDHDVSRAVLQARIDIADADGVFVPAVLSRKLVQAYNIAYGGAASRDVGANISEKSLIGQYMYVRMGGDAAFFEQQSDVAARGALIKVIGLSDRVTMLGFAVPPEYIDQWERAYFKDPKPAVYQQLVIQARSVADVEPVRQALLPVGQRFRALREERGFSIEEAAKASGLKAETIRGIEASAIRWATVKAEALKTNTLKPIEEAHEAVRRYAAVLDADADEMVLAFDRALDMEVKSQKETIDKINSVTTFVRFAFVLVVAIILGITAVGILNVLTMSVYEERVDIGILRSVGARQAHVRFIYLLKAFIIGAMGSVVGLALGWVAMVGADALAHAALTQIAYAPKTFFIAQWEFVVLSLAMGIGFALFAGISPANHAAKLNPSEVLRSA